MSSDVLDTWNATTDDELTTELVNKFFTELWDDELYVASAAIDRVVNDTALARLLLDKALAATEGAVERGKSALLVLEATDGDDQPADDKDDKGEGPSSREPTEGATQAALVPYDERLLRLLSLRAIALQRLNLLETYGTLAADPTWVEGVAPTANVVENDTPVGENDEDDDPWADEDITVDSDDAAPTPESQPQSSDPPISLSEFLISDPITSAIRLVEQSRFTAVRTMMLRHPDILFPYRFIILDAIPSFVPPQEYASLLPSLDYASNMEQVLPAKTSPHDRADWAETPEAQRVYSSFLNEHYPGMHFSSQAIIDPSSSPYIARPSPLSAKELSSWYASRIMHIDGQVGLTDVALELVQHGASQGIPGLDAIGEELSLLARLVYDTPGAIAARDDAKKWSLEKWRALDERAVVRGYLARSTQKTIADDIRRLVVPYLYVLEARSERAGQPDPELPNRVLYDYILTGATLDLCASIFEGSKPIAPTPSRIVKDDEDLARLALARLYGSEELGQWTTMSAIFECLPDWPAPPPETVEEGANSADTTLSSLTSFVQPSASRLHAAPPEDLYIFFKPLPSAALSRALDILDVHLECGEILARWGVPAPLAWFLQSAGDAKEQKSWATRMARRATLSLDEPLPSRSSKDDGGVAKYTALLTDMLRLVGPSSENARGAFRLLGRLEVTKIFFSGLLSTGKFDVAKKFLANASVRKLNSKSIEELCLAASREFYDNASSGNLHIGDMKLAYDCLTVPSQSPAIIAERGFIEATSRICSFNVQSQSAPGMTITPIEIRLTKDRLTLVARVLGESEDAYKYPDLILELGKKLGYRIGSGGDVVPEVKTWAMLADSALQSEDFDRAAEMAEKMVSLLGNVKALPSSSSTLSTKGIVPLQTTTDGAGPEELTTTGSPGIEEAVEVCWHSCFQLGRQSEFHDTKRKLKLLGHALKLCPPENTLDILAVWRKIEAEDLEAGKAKSRAAQAAGKKLSNGSSTNGTGNGRGSALSSLSGRSASLFSSATPNRSLSDYAPSGSKRELLLNQGADAALLAKQTLSRVAANWPFDLRPLRGSNGSPRSASAERSDEDAENSRARARSITPDVSASARHALSRGMGWLIGDDE